MGIEWNGEGLPPVGCECEVMMGSYWYRCDVLGRDAHTALVRPKGLHDCWTINSGSDFRPIRTKEQREREELRNLINEHYNETAKKIADAILEKYTLTEK